MHAIAIPEARALCDDGRGRSRMKEDGEGCERNTTPRILTDRCASRTIDKRRDDSGRKSPGSMNVLNRAL
jgi:hypothetical protein